MKRYYRNIKEKDDSQTYTPFKCESIVKAAFCLLVGIIPLLNILGTVKDERSRIFFVTTQVPI